MTACDILVIGGGIAGTSAACELAAEADVILLERENLPGYHSTGRSAAQYTENYGPPAIRKITTASRDFYESPPEGFCEHSLLTPRGALFIAPAGKENLLDELFEDSKANGVILQYLNREEICSRVSVLRQDFVAAGLYEQGSQDIDVHSLHQGYLRLFRARGGRLIGSAEVCSLAYRNRAWQVTTAAGARFSALVVINASGAWCDEIAGLAGVKPVGLVPKRRTAFTIDAPLDQDTARWPLVIGVEEDFYFKPEVGKLLVSPADETPVSPQDIQPDDMDIAVAVERLESATTITVDRIEHAWAGLRSFVADGVPVVGFAPDAEGFFWLAGQGGYGIQTAPAMGVIAAHLVQGRSLPLFVSRLGVTEAQLSPARLAG